MAPSDTVQSQNKSPAGRNTILKAQSTFNEFFLVLVLLIVIGIIGYFTYLSPLGPSHGLDLRLTWSQLRDNGWV